MQRSRISCCISAVPDRKRGSGLLVALTAAILTCGLNMTFLPQRLLALALAQASLPNAQVRTYVIADSAVRQAPTWVLDSVPSLTIGLDDGPQEYLFGAIVGARFLPDGGIAVADNQYGNVRIYTAEGVHLRTLGRAGGGPGEFQRLEGMDVLGDGAIATWDPAKIAVAVFEPSGELDREWRAMGCTAAPSGTDVSRFQGATLSSRSPLCRRAPDGFLSREAIIFSEGGDPDTGARPDVGESWIVDTLSVTLAAVTPDSTVEVAKIPAADQIEIGTAPRRKVSALRLFDGYPWYVIKAPWLVYGNSEDPTIRAVRYDTGEERRLRLDRNPPPVTEGTMDSVRAHQRLREAVSPQSTRHQYFEQFLRLSGDPPPFQPYYWLLMLDANHRVWIGDYLGSWAPDLIVRTAGHEFTVVSLEGEVIARAKFPSSIYEHATLPVLDIKGNRVLVRLIDEQTDVQRIGVFRLRPR